MSRMHPTAYLEHHADVYAAHLMHKHGVTLDQYLADPARYEHLLGARAAVRAAAPQAPPETPWHCELP